MDIIKDFKSYIKENGLEVPLKIYDTGYLEYLLKKYDVRESLNRYYEINQPLIGARIYDWIEDERLDHSDFGFYIKDKWEWNVYKNDVKKMDILYKEFIKKCIDEYVKQRNT